MTLSGLPFEPGDEPNVELTRDALRRDRIPAEYRSTGEKNAEPLAHEGWEKPWAKVVLPLVGWMLALRIAIPLLWSIQWGNVLASMGPFWRLLALAAMGWGIYYAFPTLRRWHRQVLEAPRRFAFWVAVVLTTLLLPNPLWAVLLLCAALAVAARMAADILTHSIRWFQSRSSAEDPFDEQRLELWRQPDRTRPFLAFVNNLRRPPKEDAHHWESEVVERTNYNRSHVVVFVSLLVCITVLVLSSDPVRGGLLGILALFGCLAVYAWLNIDEYRTAHDLSWTEVRKTLADARDSWLHYGRTEKPRIGAWTSPVGPAGARCVVMDRTFRFFAAAVLLTASYFPLVPLVTGPAVLDRTQSAVAQSFGGWSYESQREEVAESVRRGLELRGYQGGLEHSSKLYRDADTLLRQASYDTWTIQHRYHPEGWVKLSALALYFDAAKWQHAIAGLVLGAVACVFLPGLLFQVLLVAVLGRALVHHARIAVVHSTEDTVLPSEEPEPEFDRVRELTRREAPALYADHVLLGKRLETGEQRWVHRDTIHHHAHIGGATGSGKTARLISPILHQLVDGESSAVIFDLKGDPALFEEARISAERHNLGFRWFSTVPHESTFAFNPLNQSHLRDFPGLSLATIYNSALGLEYGPGYGRSHFSEQNLQLLLRLFVESDDEIRSFCQFNDELRRRLKEGASRKSGRKRSNDREPLFSTPRHQDASLDIESKLRKLSMIEALNVRPGESFRGVLPSDKLAAMNRHAIDMVDVVKYPQVVYFNLPSSLSSSIDREVGRLALFALMTAGQVTHASERRRVYVVIDEFQELVSTEIRKFFDQARNKQIAIIAANQSDAQLDAVDRTLRRAIADNVGLRIDFSANDLQSRRDLVDLSGEIYYTEESYGETEGMPINGLSGPPSISRSHNVSRRIGPRLRDNDIAAISANEGQCVVWEKQNRGQGQFDGLPDPVEAYFHISKSEFEQRSQAHWPREIEHPGAFTPPFKSRAQEQEPPAVSTPKESPPTLPDAGEKSDASSRQLKDKLNQILPPDRQEP